MKVYPATALMSMSTQGAGLEMCSAALPRVSGLAILQRAGCPGFSQSACFWVKFAANRKQK